MENMIEIRWHGRGGQGAKTASLLLADAAFMTGKYVQSFPDYVVVVDETLLESVDVTAGLKKEGAIVINSERSASELKDHLRGYEGKVYTIDAGTISRKHLGGYFPNTPMLAAIVKVSGCVDPDEFYKDMEVSFRHKFASKPQVIEGNLACLKESMKEVRE